MFHDRSRSFPFLIFIAERDSCWFKLCVTKRSLLGCCSIWKCLTDRFYDFGNSISGYLIFTPQANSSAPPHPPIRARPMPMDEERSAPGISPEPPDDGDPGQPAIQPDSHATPSTERANGCANPKPCTDSGKERTRATLLFALECRLFLCVYVIKKEPLVMVLEVFWVGRCL